MRKHAAGDHDSLLRLRYGFGGVGVVAPDVGAKGEELVVWMESWGEEKDRERIPGTEGVE